MSRKIDEGRKSAFYNLLHAAALMKHPSFRKENEWRIVIPLVKNLNDQGVEVRFRSGKTSLIPTVEQTLSSALPPDK